MISFARAIASGAKTGPEISRFLFTIKDWDTIIGKISIDKDGMVDLPCRFLVVKVDVGRFDRNVDIAQRYGVPLKKGIPTVAVLAADGTASFVTSGGELADARSMGEDALVAFFDRPF